MRRLLPFIVLILVVAGLIVAVPILLRPDRHRAEVAAYLSQRLHHEVRLGKLDVGLLPPTLQISAVSVLRSDQTPLLQSDRVDVGFDWGRLLHFQLRPASLAFSHWTASVRRRPDGSWDWQDWFAAPKGLTEGESWPLQAIVLKSGECHWVDPAIGQGGRDLAVQNIDGELDTAQQSAKLTGTLAVAPPLTLSFEGKGAFLGGGSWSGDLRFGDEGRQWIVQLQNQNGALDAKGQAKEWRLASAEGLARFYARLPAPESASSIVLNDWRTHFTWQGSSTTFYHAATIEKGLTEVKGDITSSGPGVQRVRLKGAVESLPVHVIEGGASPLFSEGKLTALITDFGITFSTAGWSGMDATGAVEIKNGRYRLPPHSAKVLSKAQTLRYLREKFPGFPDGGLPFDKISAHPLVVHGIMTIPDGRFASKDLDAALAGRVDLLRGGSDAYLRLQVHETSPRLIKLLPGKYVYGATGHEQIQPMYGHLQGTWRDWTLRALPSSKVPPAMQTRLRAALKTQ